MTEQSKTTPNHGPGDRICSAHGVRWCGQCFPVQQTTPPTAEEIQRIAEVCGEFSLGGCGIVQHRATFPAWVGADGDTLTPPEVVAVPPEKVEGIYEAIWLRLKQRPEYQPLTAARRGEEQAWAEAGRWRAKAEAAAKYIAALEAQVSPTDMHPPRAETRAKVSAWAKAAWEKLP